VYASDTGTIRKKSFEASARTIPVLETLKSNGANVPSMSRALHMLDSVILSPLILTPIVQR
jgi:hypothetical protein